MQGTIIVEAVMEPARWSDLDFADGGTVTEVLVEPQDEVKTGDLLVQVDPTDALLAVQQAEAALASAKAQLETVKDGPRPQEIAVAEAQLEAAQAALSQATARRDEVVAGVAEADIAAAQAQVAAAQAAQRQAEELHEQTMECFNVTRPDGSKVKICPALGPVEEQARYQMFSANEALSAARAQLEARQSGFQTQLRDANASVEAAKARRDAAEAQLDLLKKGSRPEEVAVAQARVAQAETALATAQAALDRTRIHAPFDGTVAEVNVKVGDTTAPGEVVVVVATVNRLQARTRDLTELDVVYVEVGQPATVTADALPDRPLKGHVLRVERQGVDYRGDVTYPVIIELDESLPALRWGMTVMIEIEAAQNSEEGSQS
jgi:HlyD family secretion protein